MTNRESSADTDTRWTVRAYWRIFGIQRLIVESRWRWFDVLLSANGDPNA